MTAERTVYHFAVLRAVPHVHIGAFHNVGVVVHAPTADFLGIRVLDDVAQLRQRLPDIDVELLARYLEACQAVCNGDQNAGPVALTSLSERFHWITAPRSDVLQASAVHAGMGDPRRALDELYQSVVS
jgi:hypothetical protein